MTPSTWETLSAIFGIIGSILLAIPSIRTEYERCQYKKALDIPAQRKETNDLDEAIKKLMEKRALRVFWWSPFDSYFIFSGVFCLVISFGILLLK